MPVSLRLCTVEKLYHITVWMNVAPETSLTQNFHNITSALLIWLRLSFCRATEHSQKQFVTSKISEIPDSLFSPRLMNLSSWYMLLHIFEQPVLGLVAPTLIKSRISWTEFIFDERYDLSLSQVALHQLDCGSAAPWFWTVVICRQCWMVKNSDVTRNVYMLDYNNFVTLCSYFVTFRHKCPV